MSSTLSQMPRAHFVVFMIVLKMIQPQLMSKLLKQLWSRLFSFLAEPMPAQLSILRRQRILAAIDRSLTNLAQLPLPNAKSWLMTSPPWYQSRPSCQRASQKIWHKLQGIFFWTQYQFPVSKQTSERHLHLTFTKYQSNGYSNTSKSQSNFQQPRSKNRFFFSSPVADGLNKNLSNTSIIQR